MNAAQQHHHRHIVHTESTRAGISILETFELQPKKIEVHVRKKERGTKMRIKFWNGSNNVCRMKSVARKYSTNLIRKKENRFFFTLIAFKPNRC